MHRFFLFSLPTKCDLSSNSCRVMKEGGKKDKERDNERLQLDGRKEGGKNERK